MLLEHHCPGVLLVNRDRKSMYTHTHTHTHTLLHLYFCVCLSYFSVYIENSEYMPIFPIPFQQNTHFSNTLFLFLILFSDIFLKFVLGFVSILGSWKEKEYMRTLGGFKCQVSFPLTFHMTTSNCKGGWAS